MNFISLLTTISLISFTTSLSAQQKHELSNNDLLNLIVASQAICYDYNALSETCHTVSFFEYFEKGALYSYNILLLGRKSSDLTKLLLADSIFSELDHDQYTKMVIFGPIKIEENSVFVEWGDDVKFLVFSSRDAMPWIHEGDRPIADVTDRVTVLLERFAEIKMGLRSPGRFCDVLENGRAACRFLEFIYKTFVDGREFSDQEGENQTTRFHFSKKIPKLREQKND